MNLTHLRSFLGVVAEGSLNRAALRLQVSQPTLTRQMQALEAEIGGKLFERGAGGVKLTDAGQVLATQAAAVLEAADRALAETRRYALGQSDQLRIGYLMSAAQDYIDPALAALRRAHPEVAAHLVEASPGEQIAALRRGELDVCLVGQEGCVLGKDFYARSLASYPAVAVLPTDHPLAHGDRVRLRDLRDQLFVSCPDDEMPGRNEWVVAQCRKAGFRPRFGPVCDGLPQLFSLVVSTPAVGVVPAYLREWRHPGARILNLSDVRTSWDLLLVWHRGRTSAPLKVFLQALREASARAVADLAASEPAARPRRRTPDQPDVSINSARRV